MRVELDKRAMTALSSGHVAAGAGVVALVLAALLPASRPSRRLAAELVPQ